MEVSTRPLSAQTPGVGSDQVGMSWVDGDERGVGGRGYPRSLRRLQQSLHGIRTVPVVVVGDSVADNIRTTGQFTINARFVFYLFVTFGGSCIGEHRMRVCPITNGCCLSEVVRRFVGRKKCK